MSLLSLFWGEEAPDSHRDSQSNKPKKSQIILLNGKIPPFLFLILFGLMCPFSISFAGTYPGYTGTSNNDGTRLNGVFTAPFTPFIQVNTYNANLYHSRTEEVIPGRGLPIELSLAYNTQLRLMDTPYGAGWTFSYNISLFSHSNGDISVLWGDGRIDRFGVSGSTFTAPPGNFDTLVENPVSSGIYLITQKRGMKFFFDNPNQQITCLRDPNGNALVFTFNVSNLLTMITEQHFSSGDCSTPDATGRSVTLTYNGGNKLESITDPASRTWSYTHNASGDLITATDPLSNTTSYTYDSFHHLTINVYDPYPSPSLQSLSHTSPLFLSLFPV